MLRRTAILIAGVTALAGGAHSETYPGGPRYDGTIIIKELSSGCSSLSDAAGDKHTAIFRSKVSESGLAEAMSIDVPHGILWVGAEFDETFAGKNQVATGTLIIDAFRSPLPDALFNLTFTPEVIDPTTVQSFKFAGKWKDYKVQGCTAKIKGTFTKRS
jgi:hypothetical protein